MKTQNFLILLFVLFTFASINADAQTKPKKRTVSTTTTNKGKVSSAKQQGTLSFDTGIIYQSGDVVPVARVKFYLLNNHLGQILKDANVKLPVVSSKTTRPIEDIEEAVEFFGLQTLFGDYDGVTFLADSMTAMKPHTIAEVTTDFGGKATFPPVAAGTYYLVGATSARKDFVVWNLKVEIKAGQNSVTLDQNNAASAG